MAEKIKGRGSVSNTTGRFESLQAASLEDGEIAVFQDEDPNDPQPKRLRTRFYRDSSRTIVTENDSPDIPFRYSVNCYRGCEHGCAYCYARPTHEYLGMSAGLDFESKIFVKERAPELLREKLMSRSWQPECIVMSGITDCYQPAERKFELTRRCLEVLSEFRNPVGIITKNQLVTRDLDLLQEMAKEDLAVVYLSITTLDTELGRSLEPRTSSPSGRLQAIEMLSKAGVPVGVNVAPVIPGLTDHELPKILQAAKEAGARFAGYVPLRLPYSVSNIFSEWLEANRPEAAEKVLSQIREMRGGKLNEKDFHTRMRGQGPRAENMQKMFTLFAARFGLNQDEFSFRNDLFRRPGDQMTLF